MVQMFGLNGRSMLEEAKDIEDISAYLKILLWCTSFLVPFLFCSRVFFSALLKALSLIDLVLRALDLNLLQ